MASIIKRKTKYSVVYTYTDNNGAKRQKWETYGSHAEAKKRKAEIEHQIDTGMFIPPNATTLSDFLDEYVSLYGVSTCLPIPLYAVVACGIFSGGNYLTAFAASMLLALAAKNYCRSYCNGYGFDAIFRASLYLGLLPLVYAPATPLVLILPLAILLFRRTFREVVVAAAGLILPVLTACYVSWGAGEEFTAPVTALADAVVSGVPLWIFTALPLPSLVMLCIIAALALTALFFFLSDIYAAGTKPRFILIFNIGILAMTLALLCTPSVTPEAFTLTAVPAALLFPVLFVRIDRRIALPVYLILLAASVYIAALQ